MTNGPFDELDKAELIEVIYELIQQNVEQAVLIRKLRTKTTKKRHARSKQPDRDEESRISDNPSAQGFLQDIHNFEMRLHHSADKDENNELFEQVDELKRNALELISLPDRFNDRFAKEGWIMYENMDPKVAQVAIEKAEANDLAGAEDDLVEYYSPEKIQQQLRFMWAIKAFHARMPLAKKALVDYDEGRYYACILVVLTLLDGLVNHLHDRGFFASGADLTADDSIAGHSTGLQALADIFRTGRKTTRDDEIRIPYRNGILHGMDLGYDNKMVAAKTWAALFAIRDWAMKAERGELHAPPKAPEKTHEEQLMELREQLLDRADTKKRREAWEPRDIQLGVNTPVTGEPDEYKEGTPERRLVEFLTYWKIRNYGFMAECLSVTAGDIKVRPKYIREGYGSRNLKTFKFTMIKDHSESATQFDADLVYEEDAKEFTKPMRFVMAYEDAKGKQVVRGKPGGRWILLNWRVF